MKNYCGTELNFARGFSFLIIITSNNWVLKLELQDPFAFVINIISNNFKRIIRIVVYKVLM